MSNVTLPARPLMFIIKNVLLKTKMRIKQKLFSAILGGVLMAPAFMQLALAATGVIYITPASSSLQTGSSETLQLRISPGTTVDGVQATVSYNTGYLQLNSVDTSGSPFTVPLQKSTGGGVITLALGNLSGGVSSDSLIATMNFTALAGSGSSSLTISGANATSSGSYTNPATSGASVSFTSPVHTQAPTSGGGGSSSSHTTSGTTATPASSNSTATATPAATTATPSATPSTQATPVHLKSKIISVNYTSATITVTSNQSLSLYALYGTDAKNLSSKTTVSSPATKADLQIGAGAALTPGTTYYYQIVGEDSSGGQTKLPVQQLTTAGYTLRTTVLDGHNQLLKHTKVTLHSRPQTVTTDGTGVATFTDVAPGVHHVSYQSGGKTYSATVYVEDKQSTQTAAVVLPVQPLNNSSAGVLIGLVAASIIVIVYSLGFETARNKWLQHEGKAWAMKLATTFNLF
jgi:hypothetical protein